MRYLFSSQYRKKLRFVEAEAKRRGVPVEDLLKVVPVEEFSALVHKAVPDPKLAVWGLPAYAMLVDHPYSGVPAIDAAVTAAAGGEWRPAAGVLAESYGDWDLRARAVAALASVAANDDGWLVTWQTERPDDGDAAVVDAAARTELAWQLRRGSTRDDDVRRVFSDAKAVAERAALAMPDDPTPWATMVRIAGGVKSDQAEFDRAWREVLARAPSHRGGHEAALAYLAATGAGDARMFAFAEEAAAKSPSLSVLVLQAALELRSDTPKVWRSPAVRAALAVLLRWLDSDEPTSVDIRDDLGYAAMALVENGRGVDAVALFRRLDVYAAGAPWRRGQLPRGLFDTYRTRACKLATREVNPRGRRVLGWSIRQTASSSPERVTEFAPRLLWAAGKSPDKARHVVALLNHVCGEQCTADRYAVAVELAKIIVDICRPRGPEFELSLAGGLYRVAQGRQQLGEPALDEAKEAVEILERHPSDDRNHLWYAAALRVLARALSHDGQHDAAVDAAQRSVDVERRRGGVNLLYALAQLREILTAAGRDDEAQAVQEELDRRDAARPA